MSPVVQLHQQSNHSDDLEPSSVDWNELELHRNVAFFDQREPAIVV